VISSNSSFVIGSRYFFRRKRSAIRTSMVGGGVLAYFLWYIAMARAYC